MQRLKEKKRFKIKGTSGTLDSCVGGKSLRRGSNSRVAGYITGALIGALQVQIREKDAHASMANKCNKEQIDIDVDRDR